MLHPQKTLETLFQTVLDAAMPTGKIAKYLPDTPPKGKTIVLGAGKAAASMALELERVYPFPVEGMVITRYQHGLKTKYIEVIEASHPVPDEQGLLAAKRLLDWAKSATEDDRVIFLVSGGASALMVLPIEGIYLEDKKKITRQLLACGAPIEEMNAVRKHLSAVKGGRLAQAAYPAEVVTLAISDVVGDDFSVIGSGPTVPDPSTFEQVKQILKKYQIELPESVAQYLDRITNQDETPKSLTNSQKFYLIVTPQSAFQATEQKAKELGLDVLYLGDSITGESRHVAAVHAGIVRQIKMHDSPVKKPALILSGGETTVTLSSEGGRGGRDTEFLLALLLSLDGMESVYAMACDTDGIDGSEDNAGAIIRPDTLIRAEEHHLNAADFLERNDAYTFFNHLNDLIVTQPTRTNINDFRAILIL